MTGSQTFQISELLQEPFMVFEGKKKYSQMERRKVSIELKLGVGKFLCNHLQELFFFTLTRWGEEF